MATGSERLSIIDAKLAGLQTRLISLTPNDIMFSALGEYVQFGCLVKQGESTNDYEVLLTGQDPGDTDFQNPYGSDTPTRGFQYWNIASGKDGAIRLGETTATVSNPPATGTARYDIAYIYVGPSGSGFAIKEGTPSVACKDDFDTYGLDINAYGSGYDPVLPLGAMPVARIYVEDVYTGIQNARIADIRPFTSNLSEAFVYIAYADDASGTGFTNTFDAGKSYIAILPSNVEIPSPNASHFTGLWKNYAGVPGPAGQTGAMGMTGQDGLDGMTGSQGIPGTGITPATVGWIGTGGVTSRTLTVDVDLTTSAVVTLTGSQTLTNKIISGGTYSGNVLFPDYTISGTTPAISSSNGPMQYWTLSGNSTPTNSMTNGSMIRFHVTAGANTLDLSAWSITWENFAPTLRTSGETVFELHKDASGNMRGYTIADAS